MVQAGSGRCPTLFWLGLGQLRPTVLGSTVAIIRQCVELFADVLQIGWTVVHARPSTTLSHSQSWWNLIALLSNVPHDIDGRHFRTDCNTW